MNIFLLYHLATKVTKDYFTKYNVPLSQFAGRVESKTTLPGTKTTSEDNSGLTKSVVTHVVNKKQEGLHKKYIRFPLYVLPPCNKENEPVRSLAQSILARKSSYDFSKQLTLSSLSPLLYYSIGVRKVENYGIKKRMYPSGGEKYPVESYIFIFEPFETVPSGVFHYDEDEHGLRLMRAITPEEWNTYTLTTYAFTKKTKAALVMTAVPERTQSKYGERAYRLIMLEAGGIAQNFGLVAAALDRPAVQMGGLVEELAEELLDIDGSTEFVVHSVFFG